MSTHSDGGSGQEAGRELDTLIAEKIFGLTTRVREQREPVYYAFSNRKKRGQFTTYTVPEVMGANGWSWMLKYSLDVAAAWLVVQEMGRRGFHARITSPFEIGANYFAGFTRHGTTGWNGRPDHEVMHETNVALCICRAALAALSSSPAVPPET